jgi:methyl-accepting chemotaxis protein
VRSNPWLTMAQAAPPEWVPHLERIMWAQVTMAILMLIIALAFVVAAVAVLLLVRRAMDRIETTKAELLPHVTPVLSRAATIADDVGHVAAGFRDNADDVQETVQDVLERTRAAVDELDQRLRRFASVLEAVQQQAEALLMDAAATARGVHTAARALRQERDARPRVGRGRDHDSTGRQ